MTHTRTNDLAAFKAALKDLANQHGFIIRGCGCCSSPWIARLDADDEVDSLSSNNDDLAFYGPDGEYLKGTPA